MSVKGVCTRCAWICLRVCTQPNEGKAQAMDESKATEFYTSAYASKHGKDGWRAFLTYSDGGESRRRSVTLKTKGRLKGSKIEAEIEAEEVRKAFNAEHAARAKVEARNATTVYEYLGRYIDGRPVERSTKSEYNRVRERLLSKELGGMALSEVTPEDVEDWIRALEKDYAPVTVRKALVVLRSMFTQAVERDLITKNPARTVKAKTDRQTRPNALDERGRAKVAGFIALDPSAPLNVGYALALFLGMRQGEICGLRWRYVDLKAGTLQIEETMGRVRNGRGAQREYVKTPKTGGSRRTLPIPPGLASALRERRTACAEAALRMGLKLDDMYVVGRDDGTPMPTHYLSTRWHKAAEALDLVGIEGRTPTFHDLRHTFATAAIMGGVDIKTVSSILGHANAAMTLNIYASADPRAKRDGVNAVAEAIAGEVDKHRGGAQLLELKPTGTGE